MRVHVSGRSQPADEHTQRRILVGLRSTEVLWEVRFVQLTRPAVPHVHHTLEGREVQERVGKTSQTCITHSGGLNP